MDQAKQVLIVYYSRNGSTQLMAQAIARGVDLIANAEAVIRTVPSVSPDTEATLAPVPETGDIYCSEHDLNQCDGLVLGSPTRFGNMAAPLKYFVDQTLSQWVNGTLIGKPAGVFSSTGSLHGGQETTLISMMLPLIHHGMVISGIPYDQADLHTTESGGTPYGPSHLAKKSHNTPTLSEEEIRLCIAFGKRIAELTIKLAS